MTTSRRINLQSRRRSADVRHFQRVAVRWPPSSLVMPEILSPYHGMKLTLAIFTGVCSPSLRPRSMRVRVPSD